MKIADVKTWVVRNPPPHFGGAYWVFLKLTTNSGIEGFGEVYSVPFHPKVATHMIEDVCERHVIGADPFKIEKLWRIVYSDGYSQRSDLSILGVLSGIETACWD
ncbi:MAG: mandelate racemase/muconate lactonizing enzyme family protein, partial [Gammaproteobacteria bacterium]